MDKYVKEPLLRVSPMDKYVMQPLLRASEEEVKECQRQWEASLSKLKKQCDGDRPPSTVPSTTGGAPCCPLLACDAPGQSVHDKPVQEQDAPLEQASHMYWSTRRLTPEEEQALEDMIE